MCPMSRDGEVSGVEQREDSGNLTRGLMPADSRQAGQHVFCVTVKSARRIARNELSEWQTGAQLLRPPALRAFIKSSLIGFLCFRLSLIFLE